MKSGAYLNGHHFYFGENMKKPFKDIDEQIDILIDRRLTIPDTDKAKRYLLTNNYYNVINGYSKFFTTKKNKDLYIPVASFEEIEALHLFDKEIKAILLKSLIEAEKHFKSVVAYRFSEKYKATYSYLKTSSYIDTNRFKDISDISKMIGQLSIIINSKIKDKHDNSIKHYYLHHKEVPFWVLCNEMTFGQIIKFYSYLDSDLKEKIAFDLSTFLQNNIENITGNSSNKIISPDTLLTFLRNANEFRNITAHNNRIFNHRCWKNLKKQKWMPSNSSNVNQQGLYFVVLYLMTLLSSTQYATLHNSILKRVNVLKRKLYSIKISKVLKALDFPEDWDSSEKISQNNTPRTKINNNIDSVGIQNSSLAFKLKYRMKNR